MTIAGGVRMAQTLIIFRSAGISMFVGAAFFLMVKVTYRNSLSTFPGYVK